MERGRKYFRFSRGCFITKVLKRVRGSVPCTETFRWPCWAPTCVCMRRKSKCMFVRARLRARGWMLGLRVVFMIESYN